VDERRFGAGAPGGFEKMQRSQRIHFEIEKGNSGGAIVRRLRGGMNDQVRTHFVHEREHSVPIADV